MSDDPVKKIASVSSPEGVDWHMNSPGPSCLTTLNEDQEKLRDKEKRMGVIKELMGKNGSFRHRYPALTEALTRVLQPAEDGAIADTPTLEGLENTADSRLELQPNQPQFSGSCLAAAPRSSVVDSSRQSETDTLSSISQTPEFFGNGPQESSSLAPNQTGLSQDHGTNASPTASQTILADPVGSPPLFFMERLHQLQSRYADVIRRRNTVQYFHEVLRRQPQAYSQQVLTRPLFQSRLQRYAALQCPTATLQETVGVTSHLPGSHNLFGPSLRMSPGQFATYPGGGRALGSVLNGELQYNDKNLLSRELALEGVQKLPKPNPAFIFYKEGCDLSVSQLTQTTASLRERTQEIERRIKQYHYEKDHEGLEKVGVDPRLSALLMAQRELAIEQERQREEVMGDGVLTALEMDTVVRRVREDFYGKLFSPCEDPELLYAARNKTKNLEERIQQSLPLRDTLLHAAAVAQEKTAWDKIADAGQIVPSQALGATRPVSKGKIKETLHKAGYSPTPVPVSGYRNVRTKYPSIYPKSVYSEVISCPRSAWALKQQKRLWEQQGQPAFADIRELTKSDTKHKDKFFGLTGPFSEARQDYTVRQQLERRALDDEFQERVLEEKAALRKTQKAVTVSVHDTRDKSETEIAPTATEVPSLVVEEAEKHIEPVVQSSMLSGSLAASFASVPEVWTQAPAIVTKVPPSTAGTVMLTEEPSQHLKRTDTVPLIRIIVNRPPGARREASILSDSALALRLPSKRCRQFVKMDIWKVPDMLPRLLDTVKTGIEKGRQGLPDMAMALYDLARRAQEPEALTSSPEDLKVYADLLSESLPFYPLQLDLLEVGLVALLKIYEVYPNQEELSASYVNCFTSLMAVDEKVLQSQLIAAIAVAMEKPGKAVLSTDLVDFLLQRLSSYDDANIAVHGLKILSIACVGHRKADQYALFVQALEHWKNEPEILVRACLALDAFAQRAAVEVARTRVRMEKSLVRDISMTVSSASTLLRDKVEKASKPLAWMPQDGSDIAMICDMMRMNPNNRKMQGAGCAALSSLVWVSELHATTLRKPNHQDMLYKAATEHCESHSIGMGVASAIEGMSLILETTSLTNSEKEMMYRTTMSILEQHMFVELDEETDKRGPIAPVLTACCHTCVALLEKGIIPVSKISEVFTTEAVLCPLLASASNALIRTGGDTVAVGVAALIAVLCQTAQPRDLMQRSLTEAKAIEFLLQAVSTRKEDAKVVLHSCRALARLVYKNPEATECMSAHIVFLVETLDGYAGDLDVALAAVNCVKCCLAVTGSVEVPSVQRLNITHLKLLEQTLEGAKKSGKTELSTEIFNCLRELDRKKSQFMDSVAVKEMRLLLSAAGGEPTRRASRPLLKTPRA